MNYEAAAKTIYALLKEGEPLIDALKKVVGEAKGEAINEIADHYQEAADKLQVQMDSLGEDRAQPWVKIHEHLENTADEIRQFALIKKED